jgi:hypothetical protein
VVVYFATVSNQNQSLHSIKMWRVSDVNWQLCQMIHYVIDHKLPHISMNVTHEARNYLLQKKMNRVPNVSAGNAIVEYLSA